LSSERAFNTFAFWDCSTNMFTEANSRFISFTFLSLKNSGFPELFRD
jgi:hypothetical protein